MPRSLIKNIAALAGVFLAVWLALRWLLPLLLPFLLPLRLSLHAQRMHALQVRCCGCCSAPLCPKFPSI